MQALWDALMHATERPWVAAVLIGWALSAGITQAFKFMLPLASKPAGRELLTRLVAVVSAAVPAAVYMSAESQPIMRIVMTTIGAGLWSPFAFALIQAALRHWWPWAADALSQDVRGVLAGDRQENRP